MKPCVVAAVFARGGSKGVPRKNLRPLAGKPLVAHAIAAARASRLIDRVVVSTDDEQIAAVARQHGAEVPFLRPAELSGDAAPEWLAWRHLIENLPPRDGRAMDVFVSVSPTSPLRGIEDVDACIRTLLAGDVDVVVTVRPAARSPYFNMVTMDPQGYARLVIPPQSTIHRRQAAPPVFDMTTVAYAARPEFVLSADSLFAGRVKAVVVPEERALDIDTECDFQIAEFFLTHQHHAEAA